MERLTKRANDELQGVYVKEHDYITASHKLADYEDLGYEPEELKEILLTLREIKCHSNNSEKIYNRLACVADESTDAMYGVSEWLDRLNYLVKEKL